MADFLTWCSEKQLDPFLADDSEQGDMKKESNSAKRAAVRSHAYPPAYGRAQYPKSYFRPIAADAAVYQEIEDEEDNDEKVQK